MPVSNLASVSTAVPCLAVCALASPAAAQFIESDVEVIRALHGEALGDSFGLELMAIGDLNGDGALELLVSAPGNDEGGADAGKVYLYDGAKGTLIRAHVGDHAGAALRNVQYAGDVDADGVLDYLFGSGDGFVYVHSGATGVNLRTWQAETPADAFGFRSFGLDDIDGDGHGDVIVGAWNRSEAGAAAGKAYLYSGATGELIRTHLGPAANAWFGHTVSALGDLDGDGVPDYAVAAPGPFSIALPGQVFVYSGATGDPVYPALQPLGTGVAFGSWEPCAGYLDLNGDGRGDFTVTDIGDMTYGGETGRLYAYDGATADLLYSVPGDFAFDGFGGTTQTRDSHLGDVDGDGIGDLLVGAWRNQHVIAGGGRADVLSGCSGRRLRTVSSSLSGTFLAGSRSGMGDVNGDGLVDFALGANGDTGTTGTVYVIAGQDHVRAPGDVNGDDVVGVIDLLKVLSTWGPCLAPPSPCVADLDCDGETGVADLLEVLGYWDA